MMTVNNNVLNRLEKLASLKVTDDKREEIEGQLSEIIGFVDNLSGLDVSSIGATFTTLNGGTQMADDIPVSQKEIADNILANAPKSENNFFIVPKIIE
jgi:aspartyl-tRNA(Asn)/glutamyl-tRNA(Gln) amidotransferase subunit C